MYMNFSHTKALANSSEFENTQTNCVPHPYSKEKEDVNPKDYWTNLFHKVLVTKQLIQLRKFN